MSHVHIQHRQQSQGFICKKEERNLIGRDLYCMQRCELTGWTQHSVEEVFFVFQFGRCTGVVPSKFNRSGRKVEEGASVPARLLLCCTLTQLIISQPALWNKSRAVARHSFIRSVWPGITSTIVESLRFNFTNFDLIGFSL